LIYNKNINNESKSYYLDYHLDIRWIDILGTSLKRKQKLNELEIIQNNLFQELCFQGRRSDQKKYIFDQ